MSKKYTLLVVFLIVAVVSFAQTGKISGKVLNSKNEPLQGVSIKITGATGGTTTDVEGRFTLTLSTNKKYELTFTAVGYAAKVVNDVEVAANQVNDLSIILERGGAELGAVTVTSRRTSARMESVNAVIAFQKNTGTVASVVSAETIRRSPDRNTGDVLKRTPGASLQDGKFLVVRGLADRYNQAMLNGILLTSTEPDRKTFSFDLIPAPMIDNIVINKAFVPEYPGEWAGGLIQVNTKDIPTQSFLNVQIGTGFNTQTIGKDYYKAKGGSWDWLGIDDGTRGLPPGYTTKSNFDIMTPAEKTAMGKQMGNNWTATSGNAPLDISFQANGGFTTKVFNNKTLGGSFGVTYNKRNRFIDMLNQRNSITGSGAFKNYTYNDDRYTQDVLAGAIGSLSLQIDPRNKVSVKSIVNINSTNYFTNRNGIDYDRGNDVMGSEITFKQNTFMTTQVAGDHSILPSLKLKWYGSFNILDGYIPDQRRVAYTRTTGSNEPYSLLIANSLSQETGSRIFQNLSDYIYTAGGDVAYNFDLFGQRQTVKGGYMLQVKDRLYDAKLFANYLPRDNSSLRGLPADKVFSPENFGDGSNGSTLFGFDAIKGNSFRYLANTILNAGFIQFDNLLTDELRVVWGVRVENYDQLVGSVKKYDPRHTHSEVLDWLPGVNATYKLNAKTNIRLSGSQTVIRPELRELSFLNLYDFELNASVQGNPNLKRTKATNLDLRYELYPRAGEAITFGVFYKNFDNAIEQIFNEGSGGASTFNFQNTDKAHSYGAEIEFRKKLDFISGLKNFTLSANAAYIRSRVQANIQGIDIDRPMQGQSPYLINLGLNYDLQKHGLNATLLFNQIGERIYLVGDISAGAGSPNIWEAPRPVLDFQVAKKVLKSKGEIRLNVTDLLNRTQFFYQNDGGKDSFQKGSDPYRFTRRFGSSFSVNFNYSIL